MFFYSELFNKSYFQQYYLLEDEVMKGMARAQLMCGFPEA